MSVVKVPRDYYKLQFQVTTPTLSFAEFNCIKEQGNQMGFLIGERKTKISDVLTDESMKNTITEESICVKSAFPVVDFVETLCLNPLQIDVKKLKLFLQKCPSNYEKLIVGWYRFRRNAVLIPSIADIRFHTQLSAYFDKTSVQSNKFLLCMFNHNFLGTMEHKFNHIFYRFENGKCLSPLKVEIVNQSTKPFIETDNHSIGYKTNIDLIKHCKTYKESSRRVFGLGYSQSPEQAVYNMKTSLIDELIEQHNLIMEKEEEVLMLKSLIQEKKYEIELSKVAKKNPSTETSLPK